MCVGGGVRACVCACVCVVCEESYIMFVYHFLRLMCIFVGLTDFVNRGVLTLVDEIPRYRNYHYLFIYFIIYFFSSRRLS